ncbi:MAG: hypothetical protein IPK26_18915 [Planctomycetes bacterium]|nr:hypothetical protein [Planctomycetota bacterium]
MLRSAVLGSVALCAVPAFAQDSILPFLPKDTIMAVNVPDLGTSIQEFSAMPLAKMWAEEEVQTFFGDLKDRAKKEIDKALAQAKEMHAQGALPVDPDKLMALRINGGTFALTRLDLTEGAFGPVPKIGVVLHLDFGATAKEWFGLAQMGLGLLEQQAGNDMSKAETKVGDAQVISLTPNGPEGMEMGLHVAMVKNGLLIGTLKDDVTGVLEAMQSGKHVLAATDRYKANAQRLLGAGAEAEMFMRVDPMLDFAIKGLSVAKQMSSEMEWLDVDGVSRAFDALGLRGIRSMGSTSTYQKDHAVSKGYIVSPSPDRRGILAGATKNLDMSFLKWVPKDAVSFSGSTFDPLSFYDALVDAVKAYDPKVGEQALGQLAKIEKQIGFTVRDDLFGALGDTMLSWSMPMSTITSAPEMAVLMKVNDADKIVKVLKALSSMSEGMVEIEEGEKRGVKAFSLRINWDPTNGMGMNPFDALTPTFAFKNGFMVAGFSASDIRRVFQRMDREDDPKGDIRGNKEFEALAALPEGIQSVSFTDWKASFESGYQMLTGVLAFLPMGEDIPIDMQLLPESGTLTKHLNGAVSYSKADGNGFETTSVGPFGPEALLLLGAAVGGAAAFAVSMRRGF